MRVLIVSDTHRRVENLLQVLENEGKFDMVIHCGDAEGLSDEVRTRIRCPLYIVAGNNDFFSDLQRELVFNIGKYRVLLTHGHHYRVGFGTEFLVIEAKARDIDIAIYGHTHMPKMDVEDGVILLNPGSISYPRHMGRVPTYIIMDVDDNGDCRYTLHHIK